MVGLYREDIDNWATTHTCGDSQQGAVACSSNDMGVRPLWQVDFLDHAETEWVCGIEELHKVEPQGACHKAGSIGKLKRDKDATDACL